MFSYQSISMCNELHVSRAEKMHRFRPEFPEPWNWNEEQIAMILYPAEARMMKDSEHKCDFYTGRI